MRFALNLAIFTGCCGIAAGAGWLMGLVLVKVWSL